MGRTSSGYEDDSADSYVSYGTTNALVERAYKLWDALFQMLPCDLGGQRLSDGELFTWPRRSADKAGSYHSRDASVRTRLEVTDCFDDERYERRGRLEKHHSLEQQRYSDAKQHVLKAFPAVETISRGRNGIKPSPSVETAQLTPLACPFYKLDTVKHFRSFSKYELRRYSDVKQHIRRVHSLYRESNCHVCTRCWSTWKEGDEVLWQAHTNAGPCASVSYTDPLYVSEVSATNALTFPNASPGAQKWFSIWVLLHQGHPRSLSPYVAPDLQELGQRIDPARDPVEGYLGSLFAGHGAQLDHETVDHLVGLNLGGDVANRPFSCPFYKFDPIRHSRCNRKYSLIDALKFHILEAHAAPIHCARCYTQFQTIQERDMHIRNVDCEKKEKRKLAGLNESTIREIELQVDTAEAADVQWRILYSVLFPGQPHPASPFADDEFVSAKHDHAIESTQPARQISLSSINSLNRLSNIDNNDYENSTKINFET